MSQCTSDGTRRWAHRSIAEIFFLCLINLLLTLPANAQQDITLPEGSTVSALGRSTQVRSDGSFSIPNVPSNVGPFRVRLIHPDGRTAQSSCLTPVNRGITLVPPLVFGPLTPVSASLTVQSSRDTFTELGQTAQLSVMGNLQGGGTANLTNDACTTYLSSNTSFATVSRTGLVTLRSFPFSSSALIVTAMNEGVVGTFSFRLQPNLDVDGDGMPNDYELRNGFNPNNPADAALDADNDGLTNLQEFQRNTDPRDSDTDRDGISDGPRDPDGAGPIIAGPDPEPLKPETTPPTCAFTSPVDGATAQEGAMVTVRATATDNVGVSRVTFTSSAGGLNFPDAAAPYETTFVIPPGADQIIFNATARDIAGNTGNCPAVTVNVMRDPLTVAAGRVVDQNRAPLAGARVSVLGQNGTTGADGRFSIPGVPSFRGALVVNAVFLQPNGMVLSGMSAPTPPVGGGTTEVGDIVVTPSADFVYANNDVSGANTVSAFSVGVNGALTPVPGSPFATGGRGVGGGFYATNRLTVCAIGNFLYVSNAGSNDVSAFAINPTTGVLTPVPGSPFPTEGNGKDGIGLAATPNNQFLYATNSGSNNVTIFSIGPNGALTRLAGTPVALNLEPDGVKVSPDGRFLAIGAPRNSGGLIAMFSIAPDGGLTRVAGSPFPDGGSGSVAGVDINCAGNLLFAGLATSGQTQVGVFNIASNGALAPITGSPFSFASGFNSNVPLLGPNDRLLFVSNQQSDTITVLNVAPNGTPTLVQGSPFAIPGGDEPAGMATNRAGTLLYVTNLNNRVSVFRIEADGKLTPVPGSPFDTRQASGRLLSLTAYPAKTCGMNLAGQ